MQVMETTSELLWFWKRVVGGEQGAVGTGPVAWNVSRSMDHQTDPRLDPLGEGSRWQG